MRLACARTAKPITPGTLSVGHAIEDTCLWPRGAAPRWPDAYEASRASSTAKGDVVLNISTPEPKTISANCRPTVGLLYGSPSTHTRLAISKPSRHAPTLLGS